MADRILVVDDDEAMRKVLVGTLSQERFVAHGAASAAEGLRLLESGSYDVVLSDVRMPGMDGLQLLEHVRAAWPDVPVLLLTAHGTVPLAVEAMRKGASDFLLKPFDREDLLAAVKRAVCHAKASENPPERTLAEGPAFLGDSAVMREVKSLLQRAAASQATVLLRGESGSGKEVAARALHAWSPRAKGPFVRFQCGALPEALIESELFGYEKGAFTGATGRKPGRVELAAGGTLFLDEVGDLPAAVQVKLLRLLQEKEFERLGGNETLKADVRFLAATHRPLEELVAANKFREDLFHRLNVIPVRLPSLSERREDVGPLVDYFLGTLSAANGKTGLTLAPAARALLVEQSWRGNVRELQNFLERLLVLSPGPRLEQADVERELERRGAGPRLESAGAPLDEARRAAEREALTSALARAKNNRTLAARLLGVSRRTLYNKLAEHGLA